VRGKGRTRGRGRRGGGGGVTEWGLLSSHHEAAAQNACRYSGGGREESDDGALTDAAVTEVESQAESYAFVTKQRPVTKQRGSGAKHGVSVPGGCR